MSDVKRYRCWCGSQAEQIDPACKTLMAKAWYVNAADYDAQVDAGMRLFGENERLRADLAVARREAAQRDSQP